MTDSGLAICLYTDPVTVSNGDSVTLNIALIIITTVNSDNSRQLAAV